VIPKRHILVRNRFF